MQEIDLPQGETLIGRSSGCQVTLEDPLVSRRHARILISGNRVTIQDLGSRNGLVVDGQRVQGTTVLRDGARIRIGTGELVLGRRVESSRNPMIKDTGFLCRCVACGMPYPDKLDHCPTCGATERRTEEDTLSGSAPSQQVWTFELLSDTAARAKDLGRWTEVDRIVRRAQAIIDSLVAERQRIEQSKLDMLADAALGLSAAQQDSYWASWAMSLYATFGMTAPLALEQTYSVLLGREATEPTQVLAPSPTLQETRRTIQAPPPGEDSRDNES